jgi:ligand-binding SRPBCC domain-containing protein
MAVINLETKIKAPIERCFLLSLSVDLHKAGVSETKEEAIAGITSGIMKLGDTVTWRAVHFGITQIMTSKISAYDDPSYFVSEMVKGPFKKLYHQHLFREENGVTIMTDIFEMQAPLGFLGKVAEKIALTNHMKKFLLQRNSHLKRVAESSEWKNYLKGMPG